jgi:hypothetical protein
MTTLPTISPLDPNAKRIGDLHRETYAEWVRRFCADRKIPWRDEYAVPVDEQKLDDRRKGAA